jgi:hypothetical protein
MTLLGEQRPDPVFNIWNADLEDRLATTLNRSEDVCVDRCSRDWLGPPDGPQMRAYLPGGIRVEIVVTIDLSEQHRLRALQWHGDKVPRRDQMGKGKRLTRPVRYSPMHSRGDIRTSLNLGLDLLKRHHREIAELRPAERRDALALVVGLPLTTTSAFNYP